MLFSIQTARADIPPGYSVIDSISYEYDVEGNRIARGATVSGVPETSIEAQYDQGNRLTQLTLKGQGQNGADTTCTLAYDLNGNLVTKTCTDVGGSTSVATQYTWDSRNRLTQIQSPSLTASFQYDPLGRRIERTVNGVTTHYLYDGNQTIIELSAAGNSYYLTGLGVDEVIARYTTQGERTLLTDSLGSALIASKEDTTVSTAYGYSPYGETQVMGTDEQNPIQYTSRENDNTGLYYYRARYYDPQLKRFVSEDPIGINGGLNVYAYVEGNPLNYSDPLGLVVEMCRRPADLPWPLSLTDHYWLKTDTQEAGMGPATGEVPGRGRINLPGIETTINDHTNESNQSDASCKVVPDVDEDCVNRLIRIRRKTGLFGPTNNCQTTVMEIIDECRTAPPPECQSSQCKRYWEYYQQHEKWWKK